MNRRLLTILIVMLLLVSTVPAVLPLELASAEKISRVSPPAISKVRFSAKEDKISQEVPGIIHVPPAQKIDPELLKTVKRLIGVRDQQLKIPIKILSSGRIEGIEIPGVKIIGRATIAGEHIYLAELEITPNSVKSLKELAGIKGVEYVTTFSSVKPFVSMLFSTQQDKHFGQIFKQIKGRKKLIMNREVMSHQFRGYKIISPKNFIDRFPLKLKGILPHITDIIGRRSKSLLPQDAYAVTHMGAMRAWDLYNISGTGINVAVIDSGVDFGNPDLQDAYAVDNNTQSPYYGWPIAFDSASMMDYLLYNMTFPNLSQFIYPWYTNTSLITAIPILFKEPIIIGYHGTNFSTAFSGMELANIQDPIERARVINDTLIFLFNGTINGRILIVDDDNGRDNGGDFFDFDPYYIKALNILGYNYTLYRVPAYKDGPNLTVLRGYSAVIWFTGEYWNDTLTDADIANLEGYLNSGGRLFLISTDFLYEHGFISVMSNKTIYKQTNVVAPNAGDYKYHYFNITENVSELTVITKSQYGEDELDIDISLYYNDSGTWRMVAYSWNWGSNESIVVEHPKVGQYRVQVYSWTNEDPGVYTYNISVTVGEMSMVPSEFTRNYLHINGSTYYYMDQGIPSIGEITKNKEKFRIAAINRGVVNITYYNYNNIELPLLVPAYSDMFSDFIIPDINASVLVTSYMALPYNIKTQTLFGIRLPINKNLTLPFKGYVKIGLHPDLALALINTPPWDNYLEPGWVLVVDSNGDGTYDKVYVDLTSEWGYFVDFNEDIGHTKENPVVAWDIIKANGTIGQDGYADISGGLIYYISNGKNPIPYSSVVYHRWNLGEYNISENKTVPKNGDLVAFMLGTIYAGGLEHGTLCAAAIGARGRTIGPEELTKNESRMYRTYGTANGAKIIAEGDLYTPTAIWEDMMLFATEGYDGVPNTGDEARITSNSYGYSLSYALDRGFNWEDRFLVWLSKIHAPYTIHFFAAGNEGSGYGTVSSNGASPGVITVGAATEFGYRKAVGWDYEAEYGDVADFSSRGPNALGQVKPDVLATGMFALGSAPLNMQYWRLHPVINGRYANELWAGTSLATPMAAGVGALVEEAFYQTHGRYPTLEELKGILQSASEDTNNEVFLQGSGYLNATRAVEIALEIGGIKVTPTEWQAGSYMGHKYSAFPSVMYPGESDTQEFTLVNYGDTKDVEISAEVFEKIGEVEIPVSEITNEPQMIPVTYAIPENTDLVKVSFHTDINNPYNYVLVRLYGYENGKLKLLNEGSAYRVNTLSFTVKAPRRRAEQLFLQVRDLMYEGYPYNGMIKLEFYRKEAWNWVTINKETLHLSANTEETFTATIKVPEDAPFGIYDGAIYVKYDNHITTIPVSVIVASPEAEFEFGGNTEASGLYDNSNVYGDEAGDWRLFYFNISSEEAKDGYIIGDISWNDKETTLIPYILQPTNDIWSINHEDIFGPYALAHTATGKLITLNESIIVAKAVPGLHAMWLYTDKVNASHTTFYGRVSMAKVTPSKVTMIAKSKEGEGTIRVKIPDFVGNLTAYGVGFERLTRKTGIIAPSTGKSWYYNVTVVNATQLRVETSSTWDNLDIDLYVYYYDESSGTWEPVGKSETWTANEKVVVTLPKDGIYLIEVYGYNNPKPGEATFDLEVGITPGRVKKIFEKQNVEAPETDNYTIHYFNVTEHADTLVVKTESEDDDNYGLDIDLDVYYYDEATDKWEFIGGSYSWTADEKVVVSNPKNGLYAAVVRSYYNPAPGKTHYNITASLVVSGGELFVKNIVPSEDGYLINFGYNLTSLPRNRTLYEGAIKIGGARTGELFDVPVEIAPNSYVTDLGITNITIEPVPPRVGDTLRVIVGVRNYGLNNASVPVKLIRDGLTEINTKIKEIPAGKSTSVSFNVSISDLYMHKFEVILQYPYDPVKENNVKMIKVRAMQPVSGIKLMWSIGDAKITKISNKSGEMDATFITSEGTAIAGVFVKLPQNWTFYSINGKDITLLSESILEDNATLEMTLLVKNSSVIHVYYGTPEEKPNITQELKEEGIEVPVFIQETINGSAKISKAENTKVNGKPALSITVTGDHNATVRLAVALPRDIQNYTIAVKDADLLAKSFTKYKTYALLTLKIKLHSPAEIIITYTLPVKIESTSISTLSFVYYLMYNLGTKKFAMLYNRSIKYGIDNRTLKKALQYKVLAEQYYKQAEQFGIMLHGIINPRLLSPLRNAYLNIRKAIEILENAIKGANTH